MLDLKQFESRCHEIFGRGTIQDFDRSARRQRYFSAWRRSINLRLGMWDFPGLVYARDGARYRANWEEYLRAERVIQDGTGRNGCYACHILAMHQHGLTPHAARA